MTATMEQSDKERGEKLVSIIKSALNRTLQLSNDDFNVAAIVEQV